MKASTKWIYVLSFSAALVGCSSKKKETGPVMADMMNPSGGPVPQTVMSDEYVKQFAKNTYYWGWPMVNIHNRKIMIDRVAEPALLEGSLPVAPINQLAMQSDYIDQKGRLVACPNQDVVSGFGMMDLGRDAVVIQVPDFGSRFWVYQLGNQRTDAFGQLGSMYASEPGFYLLVGPKWNGTIPKQIKKVFRSPTNVSYVIPKVFMAEDPSDKRALQPVINNINMYPLAQFDGNMKTKKWSELSRTAATKTKGEMKWVKPETFFDDLAQVLSQVPPLPGEENMYQQMKAMLSEANSNPKLKAAMKREAANTEKSLIKQAFYFRNSGVPLRNQWNTINNGATFGRDYLTRTSAAKANMFVNLPNEVKNFTTDYDGTRNFLSGKNKYTITFDKNEIPPVNAFWSLTAYNAEHFFDSNLLSRYSIGTKNKDLVYNEDGSLTIYLQNQPPQDRMQMANWLPVGKGTFSLMIRAYGPKAEILEGKWAPPTVNKVQRNQISKNP